MFNEIRVVLRRIKLGKVLQHSIIRTLTPPKSNIDTKNDGLEMFGTCISFQTMAILVSTLDQLDLG